MSSLGLLANFFPDAGSGGSSHPLGLPVRKPLPSGDDTSSDRTGLLNGGGGLSDMLLGVGMGLLSNRGVGPGLAQGFQNYQQLAQIGQQRKRQESLDKLAADREARMAAWQDWQRQHMTEREKIEDAQRAASTGLQREQFDFTRAQADKPLAMDIPQPDGTFKKGFVRPTGEIVSTVGAPVAQTRGRHVVGGVLVDDLGKEIYKAPDKSPSLNEDAINLTAEQILGGDTAAMTNLGRGAQGAENVAAIRNRVAQLAKERGLNGQAILDSIAGFGGHKASERTLGTQEANALAAGQEALSALGIGREASVALPRGNWVPVNMAVQAFQRGTSNPQLAGYGRAMATIANTYARAVNPKGLPHEAVVSETLKALSSAQGPGALNAMLDVMEKEIGLAQKSPAQARKVMQDLRQGKEPAVGSKPISGPGWRTK
ncbi:hypothetical protein [Methylocystis sp.]|uniref:hypothetical protein n=1 Tax=Methylocystis sp. TaxID=1911079 RepID=UPI0025E9E685|nr:hypothetical protein [Methylocystis sp.]